MGRVVVSMNLSLDGFVEAQGEDDGSWLRIDEEVHRAFNELAAGADVFVYGRRVYEVMIPYWPDAVDDASRPAHEREYGRVWIDKPKVVFSTTLEETRWNTRVLWADPVQEVVRLRDASPGYVLCYGGPQLVSRLRDVIDEYALFVHPTALGGGVPFFRSRHALDLVDVRRFDNGVLALRYVTSKRDR